MDTLLGSSLLTLLGSSPTSILSDDSSLLNYKRSSNKEHFSLSLEAFVQEVPKTIKLRKDLSVPAGSENDPVMKLFQ